MDYFDLNLSEVCCPGPDTVPASCLPQGSCLPQLCRSLGLERTVDSSRSAVLWRNQHVSGISESRKALEKLDERC